VLCWISTWFGVGVIQRLGVSPIQFERRKVEHSSAVDKLDIWTYWKWKLTGREERRLGQAVVNR
jgi:hypothetical protein